MSTDPNMDLAELDLETDNDGIDYGPVFTKPAGRDWANFDAAEAQARRFGPIFGPDTAPVYQSGHRKSDRLLTALIAAGESRPRDIASYDQLARDLNLPIEMVRSDPERAEIERIARKASITPGLAAWMVSDKYNAAIARNDVGVLSKIFDYAVHGAKEVGGVLRATGKTVADLPIGIGQTIYETAAWGASGMLQLEDYLKRGGWGLRHDEPAGGDPTLNMLRDLRDIGLDNAGLIKRFRDEWLGQADELQGRVWDKPDLALSPEWWTWQAGQVFNSLFTMAMVGAATGGSGPAAVAAGALAGGGMEGSANYAELMAEGAEEGRAVLAAGGAAAYTATSEVIPFSRIIDRAVGKSRKREILDWLGATFGEGLQEYSEEPVQASLNAWAQREDMSPAALDSLKNIESFFGGALGGGAMKAIYNVGRAQAAEDFRSDHKQLHDEISQLSEDGLLNDPDRLESALRASGPDMQQVVELPAEGLIKILDQAGLDILTPLDLNESEVRQAAEEGRSLHVPMARLHARLKDGAAYDAVSKIMRRDDEAVNVEEAAEVAEVSQQDLARVAELYQSSQTERNAYEAARDNLRQQATATVAQSPNLKAQAEAQSGGINGYVESWLSIVSSFADRMAGPKRTAAEILNRMSVQAGLEADQLSGGPLQKKGPRGSVRIYDQGYIINLFKSADLSTLLHETAHVFQNEIDYMVQENLADQSLAEDVAVLDEWLARFNDESILRAEYDARIKNSFDNRELESLSDDEKNQARDRARQEYFARGFETYLREGKTPSRGLEAVFQRFKNWLAKIYQDAALALGVDLTDEVRGVFGRLVAAEAEMAEAAGRNELLDLTNSEMDRLGFDEEMKSAAGRLMETARKSAVQEMLKDREAGRKERLEGFREEAKENLQQEKVYQAREAAKASPLDMTAVLDQVGEEQIEAIQKRAPGSIQEENGGDPIVMAAKMGYDNAAEMLNDMAEAPSLRRAVAERVQAMEAEHEAQYLALEYLLNTREVGQQFDIVSRKLGEMLKQGAMSQESINQYAGKVIQAMKMSEAIQTSFFLADQRRATQRFRRALAKGDMQGAFAAHEQARLNLELAKLSRGLSKGRDTLVRQIKRFTGMKKGDADARYVVMDTASRHGLAPYKEALARGRGDTTIQEWVNKADHEGYTPLVNNRFFHGSGQMWQTLSVDEFKQLGDSLKSIITVERNMRQVELNGKKTELKAAASDLAANLLAENKLKSGNLIADDNKFFGAINTAAEMLAKVEIACEKLDGRKMGPMWRMIYKPMSDAEDARAVRLKEEHARLTNLYGHYTPKEKRKLAGKKFYIKSLGENITWENAISILLNTGNEINLSRIMESSLPNGKAMTEPVLKEILSHVTAKDAQFANLVWEYLESFRGESFALERRLNGIEPEAVAARPFDLTLADGAVVKMNGGYYPIAYDTKKSASARRISDQESMESMFGGTGFSGTSIQTKQGHLKQRRAEGLGVPLLLKLNVIDTHVYNTVNDLTMREPAMNVDRLVRSKDLKAALEGVAGTRFYSNLRPWVRDIVRERPNTGAVGDGIGAWFRNGVSIMAMGIKAGTALLQVSGLGPSAQILGKHLAKGLRMTYVNTDNPVRFISHIRESYQAVSGKSAFMATRFKSWSREIKDGTAHNFLKTGATEFVRQHAFDLIGLAQMGVDLPTWWGAYAQALGKTQGNETEAVAYADHVVRLTQGSGRTVDLSAVQRGGETLKLLTMFYSWFNTMYNLASLTANQSSRLWKAGERKAAVGRAAGFLFWTWLMSQNVEILLDWIRDRTPDEDDDDDEWSKYLAGKYFGFWAGMVPLGGRGLDALISGRPFEATSAFKGGDIFTNTVGELVKAATDEEGEGEGRTKKITVNAVRTIGYAAHLPTEPVAQILKEAWDYVDGTEPEVEIRKTLLR